MCHRIYIVKTEIDKFRTKSSITQHKDLTVVSVCRLLSKIILFQRFEQYSTNVLSAFDTSTARESKNLTIVSVDLLLPELRIDSIYNVQ